MAAEGAFDHSAGKFPASLPAVVIDPLIDGKLQISHHRPTTFLPQFGQDLRLKMIESFH